MSRLREGLGLGLGLDLHGALSGAALPPLTFGTPLYVHGDSIDDQSYSPLSHIFRTVAKTRGRYVIPPSGNRGSAGENSQFGLTDLPHMRVLWNAFGAGVYYLKYGTNLDSPDPTVITTNIRTLIDAALAAGHRVIWDMTPHTTLVDDQGAITNTGLLVRDVVPLYSSNPKVAIVRTDTAITKTGAGDQSQGMTYDGDHYNDEGAEVASTLNAAILNAWSAAPTQTEYTNDVTSLVDGTFSGTSGTVGANMSGQMPTGWTCSRVSGDGTGTTALVTEVMDGVSYTAIELTITAGAVATQCSIGRTSPAVPTPSNDDHFDAWYGFRLISGAPPTVYWQLDAGSTGSVGGSAAYPCSRLTYQSVFRGLVKPRLSTTSTFANLMLFTAPIGTTAKVRIWAPRVTRRTVPNYAPVLAVGGGSANFPTQTGSLTVGSTLTAVPKTWLGKPSAITFSYQWLANGVAISGATASTYVLTSGESGKKMSFVMTATNSAGSTTYTSLASAAVA